jgi:hypothetical protein
LKKALSGKIDFRNDKFSHLNTVIAKVSFDENQFIENFKAFMSNIDERRNNRFRGKYYICAYLKSSEGPAFRLHPELMDPRSDSYFIRNLEEFRNYDFKSLSEEVPEFEFESFSS